MVYKIMAGQMNPRLLWMIQCMADTFGKEEYKIEDWARRRENYQAISNFLKGLGTPKILIYRQSNEATPGQEDYHDPSDDIGLFIHSGEVSKIRSKGVFFYRTVAEGKAVNSQASNDLEVMYGEIGANPISSLDTIISSVYVPLVNSMDDPEWGECDKEQRGELVTGLNKFASELSEAIKSMSGEIKLRSPDRDYEIENTPEKIREASENQDFVNHYAFLLQNWIDTINNYIDENPKGRVDVLEPGPHTELEFWRARNQRLTSISEQIRTKEVRTVLAVLNAANKSSVEHNAKSDTTTLITNWKNADIKITEALNEAKDNVKYLTTLEKFIEPLYTGTPQSIIDSLPALMNSVKMIHTIARYYNTVEKMTQLFTKITNQMITTCKKTILQGKSVDKLWQRDPDELIETMQSCIKLKDAYQTQYESTKEKLQAMPKGKQFDFSKNQIFGKFDLFCRRMTKLIELFTIVRQFRSLAKHKLEDMEGLLNKFNEAIEEFKGERHDLLDYSNNYFDRRYVKFNVNVSGLEEELQNYINKCFEKNVSIDKSLRLLKKFETILKRGSLQAELNNKYNIIFSNYGNEMTQIKNEYNSCKANPPLQRNMPTVAGNIKWARHLFHRIKDPMDKFPEGIKKTRDKDHKSHITLYNRIGQTLTLFEFMYLRAWCGEIEKSKTGLHALLLWPNEEKKLHVNLDDEIFQLIREAKCLDRMGVEIPESARIVLLQEEKIKHYYNELDYLLKEYERVLGKIRPITKPLLAPHLEDLEYKLRPGIVTLTWTSMNIDGYLHHVHSGLQKLEQLIISINDIIENRIENNLKAISKVILVEMPENGKTYTQDEFVDLQHNSANTQTAFLKSKNIEVERAVDDLLTTIRSYPLDQHVEPINKDEVHKLKKYYNWTMYQALLHCTKNSLNAMKERVCGKRIRGTSVTSQQSPFFEVTVHLETWSEGVQVKISPSIEDVQEHINRAAIAVLKCSKSVINWFQQDKPDDEEKESFYDMIAQDKEIVKVILLLTGSIHGTKNTVTQYLENFKKYNWLWEKKAEKSLIEFTKKDPGLDEFEEELKKFSLIEQNIDKIEEVFQIGAMALRTQTIKEGLKEYVHNWKAVFAKDLHKRAKARLDAIFDYINLTHSKLNKKAGGIENLHEVMLNMKEVRQKEGEIELEIKPIMDMYNILDMHLATGMEKDEQDHRHILKSKWKSLVEKANQRQNELQETQNIYKKELIVSVRSLIVSVAEFRKDYDKSGPMVVGISPKDAQERLRSFKEKYGIQERTRNTNYAGEVLFNLPHQKYVDLDQIKKELELLDMLYNLYDKVNQDVAKWKEMAWSDAVEKMNEMTDQVENFATQCKKLPKQLKEWEAYKELKTQIDQFSEVLPILKDLSKPSIKQRHWDEISNLAKLEGKDRFSITTDEVFYLSKLIEINLLNWKEDVEEIIESADKQLKIEDQLNDIKAKWDNEIFDFDTYRNREYFCRLGSKVTEIQEGLDDAQAALTTMNAMKHVTPFKAEVMTYLNNFSEVSEIIDSWQKVQIMWQSLEPVFMGGDISRNMPTEARLFQNTDKMWVKIMEKAVETQKVIPCCQNEMLKQLLPSLKEKLETCQKSLDNYLESKRNKFARFFFVSDSVLLSILSQGSEPTSIQPFLENLYDAITKVQFDTKDRKLIIAMMSSIGKSEEKIELTEPVKAEGNIEDWLKKLEEEMRRTIKDILRNASRDCMANDFKGFIEKYCAQASLTGLQLCWTYHVNECLEKAKDRKVAESKKEKMTQIWEVIRDLCLGELPNDMIRMKITTLVTVHVYQRDILDDLVSGLGKDASTKGNAQNNFEWLKRTRQYWRNDTLNISITDQDFEYQYEYLGTKERLCITPLTDRCYVTLAQALGMNYGGSPAGPAGTGKTETVKDMGRTIGEFVVVTNCSDQHRYKDMAKIFKGLCQSGLWGCFDEFNRIKLEVLSVVAMQVAAITKAKKMKEKTCQFPGEVLQVSLIPTTAYFITMNPGYAGRQELPENMKVLFRGVAMMVPNRRVIIRVKLAAQGYDSYDPLSKKFTILYALCEEQLSKQRHYDFGLRNINSVLRSAGNIKREAPKGTEEEMLLMRTLRDMNLSKLVADDEPLFLQLLNDIFPNKGKVQKVQYATIEKGLNKAIIEEELISEEKWMLKIIQVYETSLVRHGFMLVGPTASGKSTIIKILVKILSENVVQHKIQKINPKAVTSEELYGRKIELTDEWIPGVFSKLWQKFNNRNNKYNTWILCDGPVDTLWIESLNSVLDDSKILTLANNDRISMTDNVKLVFEVENLKNASPATVSRCGIVFLSEPDLGWTPLVDSWIKRRISSQKAPVTGRSEEAAATRKMFDKYLNDKGTNIMIHIVKVLKFVLVMHFNYALQILNLLTLLTAMLNEFSDGDLTAVEFERLFLYCIAWSIGGLIDQNNRRGFHEYLVSLGGPMPQAGEGETIYEYGFDSNIKNWVKWQPPQWTGKATGSFASLLIPTLDSTRAEFLISKIFTIKNNDEFNNKQVLIVGAPGTAKTSTILMYTQYKLPDNTIMKKLNFSSATQPKMFQDIIDDSLEKGVGRNFYPPGKKTMLVFIDDVSMPFVNTWGDQVTLEIVRQLIEERGYYFLEKDKIGDFKKIENLIFISAMGHPTGGRNDIPNRLKRQFFTFNMILPSKESIDNIYLVIINMIFQKSFTDAVSKTASMLTRSTLELWDKVQIRFKPTPSQFHYLFNMRELSRVFQGIVECVKTREGKEVIKYAKNIGTLKPEVFLVGLWKHECERVFEDKLTTKDNKDEFKNFLRDVTESVFGSEFEDQLTEGLLFCDFQRKDKLNEEGEIEEEAPKVYEAIKSIPVIKKRIEKLLENYNADSKGKTMNLVLFDDAIRHLLRISRVIQMDRGNMLLVGVGGSGKQSLTRLAAYIGKHICYQITLTKTYNQRALFEDLLQLYKWSGHEGKKTTFILTDSEVKQEYFLEFFNSFLSTGEVAGLIQKEEKDIILADMRDLYAKEKPNVEPDNLALNNFFIERVRNNLHLVLSFSPVGDKFRERFRKFPAIFNGCTINWFLPWPKEALISVSKSFIESFPVHCTPEVKESLTSHMGRVHNLVNDVCSLYYNKMRRHVYVTPKSYLSFISSYKTVYKAKVTELEDQEKRVALGLKKLKGAEEDVKEMQIKLETEKQKINEAEQKTEIMLKKLKVEKSKAEKQSEDVSARKTQCERQAETIRTDQQEADRDLQAALPYLQSALDAVDKITGPDINEIKTAKKPADIIKLIFDGVLVLFGLQINGTNFRTHGMRKLTFEFLNDSFDDYGKPMINDPKFLAKLIQFSREEKDKINDETCELLSPYLELEHFTAQNAKAASNAAEGLCIWVRAMVDYHEASKIVKPKMDFLTKQNQKLEAAMSELAGAEAELKAAQDILSKLEQDFTEENNKKKVLEENMNKLKRKTDQANKLIVGLTDEKARWTEDSKNFADLKRRLIGDVAVSTAFMSYCGAFNSEFRNMLMKDYFIQDLTSSAIPVTLSLDLTSFLVEKTTVSEWNLQGLPKDDLSTQNGIMVTRASRFPLMIDPQGQAHKWILAKEKENLKITGMSGKFMEHVRFCLENGMSILIENIENEVDPELDPVLEKQTIQKGRNKVVMVSGQSTEWTDSFKLFMTSRLGNPHFSPELAAKTTIIDFTVTIGGLEQQLLGRVLSKEQRSLEESLQQLLEEITANAKSLEQYNKNLLERLSKTEGNLIDDTELIEVLNSTKAKAKEVQQKLFEAKEKQEDIGEKREIYRPVATRGSLLYFGIVEMSLVNWMYNTSLTQFLQKFDESIEQAEKAATPQERVKNITIKLTYIVYRYINRGLFEKDKLTFLLMICLKILLIGGKITQADADLLLKSGRGLDKNSIPPPKLDLDIEVWKNVIALSKHYYGKEHLCIFGDLPSDMDEKKNEWKAWLESTAPEKLSVPKYQEAINSEREIGKFIHFTLVRGLKEDRTIVCAIDFIENLLGKDFVSPVTDSMEEIWSESTNRVPVLFLLSAGADPTSAIEEQAKRKKKTKIGRVSMGEGQEVYAKEEMKAAFANGGWVILYNCHLGLEFMAQMETLLGRDVEIDPDFRLWLTCEPRESFPIGLLQMAIKVTNEPPKGLKAGMARTFSTIIDNDFLEKHDMPKWRYLVFILCFLHSVVIERRKFGALGWCIPYEFNNSDLEASLTFIDRHIYQAETVNQEPNPEIIKYMVCDVQYGGRITDEKDFELMQAFGSVWLENNMMKEGVNLIQAQNDKDKDNADYKVIDSTDVQRYRDYIHNLPNFEKPSLFYLNNNAEVQFRRREGNDLLNTIQMTQPKDSDTGTGKTRDDVVFEYVVDTLQKLPPDYIEGDVRDNIKKLPGPPKLADKGFNVPLNIFLFQEIMRLQNILGIVRRTLEDLKLVRAGAIILTPELQDAADAIYDSRVPKQWLYDANGSEISWLEFTLGNWITGLYDRNTQLAGWLKERPVNYNLGFFFNPQGFLTASKQEITRLNQANPVNPGEVWSLDDVEENTMVRDKPEKGVGNERGVIIKGLYLDGAKLSNAKGNNNSGMEFRLEDLTPKDTVYEIPCIFVGAKLRDKNVKADADFSNYVCPVYKYRQRTDKYFIFNVKLKAGDGASSGSGSASSWKLKGVAVLCQKPV